jgi:RNase P/RNase MRP subunit POP5
MVVRDKVGRKRYVVLTVNTEGKLSPDDLERAVVSLLRDEGALQSVRPKLIDFDGRVGIMRCSHTGKDALIALLNSMTVVSGAETLVETVKTSGTLRKARTVAKGLASS